MKKRIFVCLLVVAILVCSMVAYAKTTTTPNGYTIDFTYDKHCKSSSSMYNVRCEAEATLKPGKSDWYVRAYLIGPLGNTIVDSGREFVAKVSTSNYAESPYSSAHYNDLRARGNWGGIY